jgi:transposase
MAGGRPLRLHLSEVQRSDCTQAEPMLDASTLDSVVLANKAYDTDAIREKVKAAGAFANIPAKRTRKQSFAFSPFLYRYRNLVERFFWKTQERQRDRHPLRSARRQLPCCNQALLSTHLDP